VQPPYIGAADECRAELLAGRVAFLDVDDQ